MRGSAFVACVVGCLPLLLAACTTQRATSPQRTATEELLISTAADRAAAKLAEGIPTDIKVFLDTANIAGPDAGYAALTIRDCLLRRGVLLVADRTMADAIIEVRSGSLSTDEHSIFLGTPDLPIPGVPGLTGGFLVPSLNLFKRAEAKATAKFAATGYDPKTGKLVIATDPQFGNSQKIDWSIFLFFSWTDEDYLPPDKR
ncbi:MAG TPA: DUF6655 family protein [Micropepsaceae bacterium]|nr:DUF6655 family protein [Micropepsaceae bacterium]